MQKKCVKTILISEYDGGGNLVRERHNTMRFFDSDKGYLFRMNKEAVNLFKGYDLPKTLREMDVARVYRLAMATQKESNLICYRSGNALKPMTKQYMSRYLGASERQVTAFLNRMIKERIIGKVKVRVGCDVQVQYYINPIYFFNGKWLNHNLYWIFRKDLDAYLPMWVKERFSDARSEEDAR